MVIALERGQTFPDFTVDDIHGERVSSRSFYMRRNFIIALLPEQPDERWTKWLTNLSAAVQSIPDRDAITLIISPPSWREMIEGMSIDSDRIKFLIDQDGAAARRFEHGGSTGQLLIADQYGVVFHAASAGDPETPELNPEEVPSWMELIVCQCS